MTLEETMPTVRNPRLMATWVALCASALLGVGQAQAHAKLVTADPAPNATVAAPTLIQLQFSEAIAKKLSSAKLTDTDGNAVATMSMESKDAKSLAIMPNSTLAAGVYTVTWTAVSTGDGHKMTGNYSFTVR
jgi:methionine-rich copper-binding protein CopC